MLGWCGGYGSERGIVVLVVVIFFWFIIGCCCIFFGLFLFCGVGFSFFLLFVVFVCFVVVFGVVGLLVVFYVEGSWVRKLKYWLNLKVVV